MNLHAFFLLVHPNHFNIVEVIVLFWLFFHSTRLRLLNFVNKTFWWSRFSFWTSRHLEFWSHRASAMMPPSCKSHQYQMSYFVGNDFDMSQAIFLYLCFAIERAVAYEMRSPREVRLECVANN